ncbi:hypothetical protein SAMD00019534_074660, partial [Acytostelium subglobosum LB1]|uniref:hypothetical protein n=1 Tax=Acytostelium subglobosum LB1 TaxID=1410327 RepID=UPI000644F663
MSVHPQSQSTSTHSHQLTQDDVHSGTTLFITAGLAAYVMLSSDLDMSVSQVRGGCESVNQSNQSNQSINQSINQSTRQ